MNPLRLKLFFIFPAAFLGALGIVSYVLGSVFYLLDRFHLDAAQIGLFASLHALAYITGCLVFGHAIEKARFTFTLLISSTAFCMILAAFTYTPHLAVAHLLNILAGLVLGVFWPPMMGWVSAGFHGKELNGVLSIYNLSWSSGTVVGPFLTGLLSDRSPSLPIRVGAGIFLAVIALVAAARLFYSHTDPVPHLAKKTKAAADHSTILRFPAWIGVFTSHTLIGIILNIFPVFARRELHFSKTLIGALLLFRAAATATTFISMGRMHFWHKNRTFLILLQVALAVASVAMIFPNQVFPIGLFLALLGVLIAMSYMSSIYHGVDGAPNKSSRMAIHETLLTLGILLGAYAGGWLYEHHGVAAVWLGASGLLIAGLAAMVFFTGQPSLKKNHFRK